MDATTHEQTDVTQAHGLGVTDYARILGSMTEEYRRLDDVRDEEDSFRWKRMDALSETMDTMTAAIAMTPARDLREAAIQLMLSANEVELVNTGSSEDIKQNAARRVERLTSSALRAITEVGDFDLDEYGGEYYGCERRWPFEHEATKTQEAA